MDWMMWTGIADLLDLIKIQVFAGSVRKMCDMSHTEFRINQFHTSCKGQLMIYIALPRH